MASEIQPSDAQAYLDTLLKKSKIIRLAEKPTWHALMHYRENWLGSGVTSEIDDAGFFLANRGKTDPEAELSATLKAFISSEKIGKQNQLSQCAYPARYHWLSTQLQFDTEKIPVQRCEIIELWRERVNADSASLIFASYYLNNPASMFGHTLLRFNSSESARPDLLDFVINYAAIIEEEDGFVNYAWKGLTGGFEGHFSVYPYYDLVKLYNDLENRDLWEYRLNLTPEQIDFMLLHAWELTHTHFDFYFVRENCSYHLLSLLEVANPELQLREAFSFSTLPTETIKQLMRQPGLVQEVVLRPSIGTRFSQQLSVLRPNELEYVSRLYRHTDFVDSVEFKKLTPDRQALIVDAAISLLQIENHQGEERGASSIHSLLGHRSRLPPTEPESINLDMLQRESPDKGHGPRRFELSIGGYQLDADSKNYPDNSFFEMSFQPGFHNLLSSEEGHAPNSQINYLNLRVRYQTEIDDWQLQQLTLIDIVSLLPRSQFLNQPSWKINIGWDRVQDGDCDNCTPFIINPGLGLTLQTNLHQRELYFGFLEADLQFDDEFDSNRRAGYGASLGMLFDATENWRLALTANRARYISGEKGYSTELELLQRFMLARNSEMLLEIKSEGNNEEAKLGLAIHF